MKKTDRCGLWLLLSIVTLSATLSGEGKAAAASALPVCQMIATGGTIAMKIDPVKGGPVPALSGEDLVASVPGIDKVARVQVENLFNIPSDYMDPEHWVAIQKAVAKALSSADVAGVMISHGTDTLEETAYFLDLTIASDKPVVLVGAQRNASEPDFDGPGNLIGAARTCVSPQAHGKGVMIVLNNQINAAREATKTHTSSVETFKSGDYGLLGVVDQDRVEFYRSPARRQYVALKDKQLPRVDIVAVYAGADGTQVRAAAAAGAKGIVIQALGMGNVNIPVFESIKDAIKSGVVVVVSTRVPNGRVLPNYGTDGGGQTLKRAGAVFADNLSPHKARILLMLALQGTSNAAEIQALFDR